MMVVCLSEDHNNTKNGLAEKNTGHWTFKARLIKSSQVQKYPSIVQNTKANCVEKLYGINMVPGFLD